MTATETGDRLTGWVKLNCDGPESVMGPFMRWISLVPVYCVRQRSILARYLPRVGLTAQVRVAPTDGLRPYHLVRASAYSWPGVIACERADPGQCDR